MEEELLSTSSEIGAETALPSIAACAVGSPAGCGNISSSSSSSSSPASSSCAVLVASPDDDAADEAPAVGPLSACAALLLPWEASKFDMIRERSGAVM